MDNIFICKGGPKDGEKIDISKLVHVFWEIKDGKKIWHRYMFNPETMELIFIETVEN